MRISDLSSDVCSSDLEANAKDCFRSKQEPHMAARAYWQGQIRLALVSIAVEVYSATKSGAQISFRQIHEPSGKPVEYEKVVPGIGPVEDRKSTRLNSSH